MNISELENKIEKLGLGKYNPGNMPMRELELSLMGENNKWVLYQSFEKRGYNVIKTFDKKDEACDLILYF